MGSLKAFWRLIAQLPRAQVLILALLMLGVSATEGLGLFLLVPLLGLLSGEAAANPLLVALANGLRALGLPLTVSSLLLLFVLLVGVRAGIQYAREQLGVRLERRLIDGYRVRSYAALLGVEWRWLAQRRRSDHANLLLANVDRLGVGLTYGIGLVAATVTTVAYLLVAGALAPALTAAAIVAGVLVYVLLSGQRRRALALGYAQTRARRSMFANVEQTLSGIRIAKILGSEQRHLRSFADETADLRARHLEFLTGMGRSRALFQVGGAALLALYIYTGLSWWRVPVPELLTVAVLLARLVPMLMSMQQAMHHWVNAIPALYEVEALLAECAAAAEPAGGEGGPIPLRDAITLDAVTLSWPGRDRPAVDRVSFAIAARTTVAIIGPSGSGKSSIADLLMGLLEPDGGSIRIDGVPLDAASRMRWRRSVAYVPQDVFLFHDSIRANLLWGHPAAGEAELDRALSRAAADFVHALPDGLDTVVGDAGVRLSGGERQRLALARALLGSPSLLILDEATSALDVANEARIRDAIEAMHGDLTVVIIGHRLPTLEHADMVVRMTDGRVTATGRWGEVAAA